jgi:hypothetical protein
MGGFMSEDDGKFLSGQQLNEALGDDDLVRSSTDTQCDGRIRGEYHKIR